MYKNVTELAVEQKLEELWRDYDCCKCEQCHDDIMAYALNHIKTKYVSSTEGTLYSKAAILIKDYEVEIITAVTKAILQVQSNPRH